MSKLDDVLDGTYKEPEHDHHDDVTGYPASDEDGEPGIDPADFGYETAEEILTAEANGEITEDEAVALLDALEGEEPKDEPELGDEDGEDVANGAPLAGPGAQVRLLKTGEIATVAHMAGDGAVSLRGEEKPKRTVARHEYALI